jgi:hypothetical protein
MILPLNTTELAVPSMETPMRIGPFSDYCTFASTDRTDYALAHTNIRHSQDDDCAPPALLGLCIDPVVLSLTNNKGSSNKPYYGYAKRNMYNCIVRSQQDSQQPATALRIWQLASNGTLFQRVYTINDVNQMPSALSRATLDKEIDVDQDNSITIDDWPRDDPSVNWITKKKHMKLLKMKNTLDGQCNI